MRIVGFVPAEIKSAGIFEPPPEEIIHEAAHEEPKKPSRRGKTTLGKIIAGLYRPSGGKITLFGKEQNPKQLQKQVLFIMQEAEFQFFTNSVLHELQYGHKVTPELCCWLLSTL